jgi:16S rRNA (adenine1518-N6/adenine1519-N6)-dimethyltransferase
LTRYGQNFLIDLNLQRLLVDAAHVEPGDVVLEVGTGTGSVTAELAKLGAKVVTVEVDRRMYDLAARELAGVENVVMLHRDALKNKNRLHPDVMRAVQESLESVPNGRFKVVANLPYNIATPLITNLLAGSPVPATMTVTIQKELADRIVAQPATKDYGSVSVWIQSQCRAEIVRVLPPEAFWPRPKVSSAIVQIVLDEELRERIPELGFFHHFVRTVFFHRRKFLRSVIASGYKGKLELPDADLVLAEMKLDRTTRAEELDVPTMFALSERIRARVAIADETRRRDQN